MSESSFGTISIESGVLGVGDPTIQVPGGLHPDDWVKHIKEGKAIGVSTGGDGTFGVIIRDSKESFDLLSNEGKKISSLSAPLLLNVPSGNLIISDMGALDESNHMAKVEYSVEPGIYECMIYFCQNESTKDLGFVIVLKKSISSEAKNEKVWEIEQLG